ncbi:MAG: RNA methyltransferase [Candidatus Kapabacteria bacterium]|nr:RNA methyltransferase [Candidatus Kapabacteria bacterium]MDW8012061.1 RNA methyltransferase [Bacteroidota bacterium]
MRKLSYEELCQQRLTIEQSRQAVRHPITIVLDNIRSLYNVGSIFRTADAIRAQEVILCGYTPAPPRPEIEKTALGATESVPWRYVRSCKEAIQSLRSAGIRIFAVELTDTAFPYDGLTTADFPAAFVFGNEIVGIQPEVLQVCDAALAIPMYGVKHSLNVAVAAGIVLYEALRCYRQGQWSESPEATTASTNDALPTGCSR